MDKVTDARGDFFLISKKNLDSLPCGMYYCNNSNTVHIDDKAQEWPFLEVFIYQMRWLCPFLTTLSEGG